MVAIATSSRNSSARRDLLMRASIRAHIEPDGGLAMAKMVLAKRNASYGKLDGTRFITNIREPVRSRPGVELPEAVQALEAIQRELAPGYKQPTEIDPKAHLDFEDDVLEPDEYGVRLALVLWVPQKQTDEAIAAFKQRGFEFNWPV